METGFRKGNAFFGFEWEFRLDLELKVNFYTVDQENLGAPH